jgi:hypothetical protein
MSGQCDLGGNQVGRCAPEGYCQRPCDPAATMPCNDNGLTCQSLDGGNFCAPPSGN